eukprot:10769241-Heterocapsa_arctica.AAC.1
MLHQPQEDHRGRENQHEPAFLDYELQRTHPTSNALDHPLACAERGRRPFRRDLHDRLRRRS